MLLVWNARGAAGKAFCRALNELRKNWRPVIVVLLETRCSGCNAQRVIKKMGFSHQIIEEANGMSGGIWILWNDPAINISILSQKPQFVHCLVTGLGRVPWCFTAVYGSPREHERQPLWRHLWDISRITNLPWMLAGDFNDIKDPSEQKGGALVNEGKCRRFLDNINRCKLIDLGAEGPKFTWRGPISQFASRLFKRLDRGLCNADWRTAFPEAVVTVGTRLQSDHHPLLISLDKKPIRRGARPFRFEAVWFKHQSFRKFIAENWSNDGTTWEELAKMEPALLDWNMNVFGNVLKKKRELLGSW